MYFLTVLLGIFNFRPGAGVDVAANVDDVDGVGHVDLAFMHVVQHLLGAFCCPDGGYLPWVTSMSASKKPSGVRYSTIFCISQRN